MNPETARAEREILRNRELDEMYARLTISHEEISDEFISSLLGITFSDVLRPDDIICKTERYDLRSDRYICALESELDSKFPEEHVSWLLDQLFGKLPAIRQLQAAGAEFQIRLFVDAASGFIHTEFSVMRLQQLAQFRIPLMVQVRQMGY